MKFFRFRYVSTHAESGELYFITDYWNKAEDCEAGLPAALSNDFILQVRRTGSVPLWHRGYWLLEDGTEVNPYQPFPGARYQQFVYDVDVRERMVKVAQRFRARARKHGWTGNQVKPMRHNETDPHGVLNMAKGI